MQIVYDKHSEEYGVLKKKPFKDMLVDITKSLKKNMPKGSQTITIGKK